jgi:ferredoxin
MTADALPFRIDIDHDVCIGSGTCVAAAPSVFRLNEAGQAEVNAPELATLDIAREAAADCPSEAITVIQG